MGRVRIPLNSLGKAIVARLQEDIGVDKAFRFVPQGTAMPYVRVGEFETSDDPNKSSAASVAARTIHAYDSGQSEITLNELLENVMESLTRAPLVLEDDWECSLDPRARPNCKVFDEELLTGEIVQHGMLTLVWRVRDKKS